MKQLVALVGFAIITGSPAAFAVTDAEFQQLKEQFQAVSDRLAKIEAQNAEVQAENAAIQAELDAAQSVNDVSLEARVNTLETSTKKMSWAERIKLKGDFRFRYQNDDVSGRLATTAPYTANDTTRNRERIRARVAVIGKVSDSVEMGFGLATGGDDPVSSNQTLGGGGSSKAVQLDLAYVDWNFAEGAQFSLGKFTNQFFRPGKNGLVWDSDWRPEGFDLNYKTSAFYFNGLGTWLEGDSNSDLGTKFTWGVQGGFTPEVGIAKFNLGASYFNIKSEGLSCYDAPSNDKGGNGEGRGCFGNTAVESGTTNLVPGKTGAVYAMNYAPAELYATVDFDTDLPFGFFADYIQNLDAKPVPSGPSQGKKLDTAYALGVYLGKSGGFNDWVVKLSYQDKDADAVLGLLTDSDFGGGGTDSKGWVGAVQYGLAKQSYIQLTYFDTERKDSNGVESGKPEIPRPAGSSFNSNPFDVNTLQLDIQFKTK